jgi:hypothetical protein
VFLCETGSSREESDAFFGHDFCLFDLQVFSLSLFVSLSLSLFVSLLIRRKMDHDQRHEEQDIVKRDSCSSLVVPLLPEVIPASKSGELFLSSSLPRVLM